jgi:hypothetical protein
MLLQIIVNLGVSSAVHKWIKLIKLKVAYRTDAWQNVRIRTTSLAPVSMSYEILQGSVMLALFSFNIYTYSLYSVPKYCILESYVHDTKTFLSLTLSHMQRSLLHIERI